MRGQISGQQCNDLSSQLYIQCTSSCAASREARMCRKLFSSFPCNRVIPCWWRQSVLPRGLAAAPPVRLLQLQLPRHPLFLTRQLTAFHPCGTFFRSIVARMSEHLSTSELFVGRYFARTPALLAPIWLQGCAVNRTGSRDDVPTFQRVDFVNVHKYCFGKNDRFCNTIE